MQSVLYFDILDEHILFSSEQLEAMVEAKKHQFKLSWKKDKEMEWAGDNERLASFVDVDPMLKIDDESLAKVDSFCIFICLTIKSALISCFTCRCCRRLCSNHSKTRREQTLHRLEYEKSL